MKTAIPHQYMRNVRGELESPVERSISVDENASIQITLTEEETHDSIQSINAAKQLEIKFRSLERFPGCNRRPDPGSVMQQVVISLELEDAEGISLSIVDKWDIAQRSDDKEHCRV